MHKRVTAIILGGALGGCISANETPVDTVDAGGGAAPADAGLAGHDAGEDVAADAWGAPGRPDVAPLAVVLDGPATPDALTCPPVDQPTCCGADTTVDLDGNQVPDCQESALAGGQFTRDLGAWRATDTWANWSGIDARGSGVSGSVQLTVPFVPGDVPNVETEVISACVPLAGEASLTLLASTLIPAGQSAKGGAGVRLVYSVAPDCSGLLATDHEVVTAVGPWTTGKWSFGVTPGARSVSVTLTAERSTAGEFVVHFDDVALLRR
jgi:hypothetical protein